MSGRNKNFEQAVINAFKSNEAEVLPQEKLVRALLATHSGMKPGRAVEILTELSKGTQAIIERKKGQKGKTGNEYTLLTTRVKS